MMMRAMTMASIWFAHVHVGTLALVVPPQRRTGLRQIAFAEKGPVSEIVDLLDSMLGADSLTETDLKDANARSDENFLRERGELRQRNAPQLEEALDRPSISVFIAVLFFAPLLGFFLAVQSGLVRPFGL